MSDHTRKARDDLAFMRDLVEAGSRGQMTGGSLFLAGGLLYGGQCLADWAGVVGLIPMSQPAWIWISILPTVVFLSALGWVLWKERAVKPALSQRAINAAFAAAGVTNLAMLTVFGVVAERQHNFLIWELYPAVVFALQGAAWLVAYAMRRRLWLLAVALGWLACSVALGLTLGSPDYILIAGLGMILLMAGPGLVMIRLARRAA